MLPWELVNLDDENVHINFYINKLSDFYFLS